MMASSPLQHGGLGLTRRPNPSAPFVPSRWRAAQVSAPMSLSNADQRLTLAANNTSVARTVPVANFKSTGKWYAEVRAVNVIDGNTTTNGIGVCTSDFSFGTKNLAGGTSASDAAGLWGGSSALRIYRSGTFAATPDGSIIDTTVVMIAMDIDNRRLWFGTNGVWRGTSADPGAGTGIMVGSANLLSGKSWAPACSPWSSDAGAAAVFDIYSGASECQYSLPSGFSYW